MNRFWLLLALSSACAPPLCAFGCGTGNPASPSTTSDAATGDDASAMGDDGSTSDSGGDVGATPISVTFAYQAQWSGVIKVEVVGGFGQASDWSKTASLVTLTDGGSGSFTGAAMLPPGTYLYVFRVTGDALAPNPTTYGRYALDPLDTSFAPCPVQSPTYSKIDANPCSQLVVGQTMPAAAVHVKGTITVDGAPAAGWMVWLEREEPQSHHYFVNRVTAGTDGAFDLVGSAGHYRLQVQHPTLLSENDLQRAPVTLATLRRAISNAFVLASGDVTVTAPDLAFHAYPQFGPVGSAMLPTPFTFEAAPGTKLDVYGGPGDGGAVEIGDPWYASPATSDGGAVFNGAFGTKQAMQDAAAPGTRYLWGTEETFGADASVAWTKQTMVFPIVWH